MGEIGGDEWIDAWMCTISVFISKHLDIYVVFITVNAVIVIRVAYRGGAHWDFPPPA